jgi:hypothetical protein
MNYDEGFLNRSIDPARVTHSHPDVSARPDQRMSLRPRIDQPTGAERRKKTWLSGVFEEWKPISPGVAKITLSVIPAESGPQPPNEVKSPPWIEVSY